MMDILKIVVLLLLLPFVNWVERMETERIRKDA